MKNNRSLKPDGFVVLKIKDQTEVIYRLFSIWRGGYLGNDSWRLNSGITKVTKENDTYTIYGNSSTVYQVHNDSYGRLGLYGESILKQIIKGNDVEIIDIEQCYNELEIRKL